MPRMSKFYYLDRKNIKAGSILHVQLTLRAPNWYSSWRTQDLPTERETLHASIASPALQIAVHKTV